MMPRTGDRRGGDGPRSRTGRLREASASPVGGDMLGDVLDEVRFVRSRSSLFRTSPIAASIIASPAAGLKKTEIELVTASLMLLWS